MTHWPTGTPIVLRITIQTASGLVVGKPENVFTGAYMGGARCPPHYDVTADGQRMLTIRIADSERAALPIRFVVNWTEELKQRVPTR